MLLYIIALPALLYIGGTAALYFGGLIKTIPLFFLLGRWMDAPKILTATVHGRTQNILGV